MIVWSTLDGSGVKRRVWQQQTRRGYTFKVRRETDRERGEDGREVRIERTEKRKGIKKGRRKVRLDNILGDRTEGKRRETRSKA